MRYELHGDAVASETLALDWYVIGITQTSGSLTFIPTDKLRRSLDVLAHW
jgi:hypothetical protein